MEIQCFNCILLLLFLLQQHVYQEILKISLLLQSSGKNNVYGSKASLFVFTFTLHFLNESIDIPLFTFSGPAPQKNCQCFLYCDEAHDLKKHESVHVLVEQHSETVLDEIFTVSSLYDGGRCSVPGCFERDTRFMLKIYANNVRVPKLLYNKTDLQPGKVLIELTNA